MLIIEVMGGLGNQLQQYALYQKMKSLGKEVKLDISWFEDEKRQASVLAGRKLELRYFKNLPMEIAAAQEKERLIGRDGLWGKVKKKLLPGTNRHFQESSMYHPEIFDLEDAYLSGFWACEKYYADILPKLRELIVFPETTGNEDSENFNKNLKNQNWQNVLEIENNSKNIQPNQKLIENSAEIQNNNVYDKNYQIIEAMKKEMSVSIHIRRGDYLDSENAAMFGGICTDAYYRAAIDYLLERYPDAHFYIFSDDISYVREKYTGSQYTVVDWNKGENSFFDIQLMSCCKHNICANSTFSFWGARLNPNPDKIMIRPAKHKNSQQIVPEQMHDWWKGWTIFDEKGNLI